MGVRVGIVVFVTCSTHFSYPPGRCWQLWLQAFGAYRVSHKVLFFRTAWAPLFFRNRLPCALLPCCWTFSFSPVCQSGSCHSNGKLSCPPEVFWKRVAFGTVERCAIFYLLLSIYWG